MELDKKIVKIDLDNNGQKYKILSMTRGSDGSIYVSFPMEIKDAFIYNKFSYHPDGKCHMKGYDEKNHSKHEMRYPQNVPINKIKGIVNTNLMISVKNLSDIPFNGISLKDGEGIKNYSYYKEVASGEYANVTIRFFILEKGHDYKGKNTREYKEIIYVEQEDIDFLITLEDMWAGK